MRTLITILCAMFLLPTVSLAEGKKYALLVGVAKYDPAQLNRLQFAEDDATEMGKVLEKLGFEVVVMTAQQSVPERVPVTAQD
ncbi:MAG: caspase family protein, partial [Planctomycetaceae bacterium]